MYVTSHARQCGWDGRKASFSPEEPPPNTTTTSTPPPTFDRTKGGRGGKGRRGDGDKIGRQGEDAIFRRRVKQTKGGMRTRAWGGGRGVLSSQFGLQTAADECLPTIINRDGKRKRVSPKMAVGTKGSVRPQIQGGGGKRVRVSRDAQKDTKTHKDTQRDTKRHKKTTGDVAPVVSSGYKLSNGS